MSSQAPASFSTAPPMLDLTIDNITPNVQRINSQCPDPRLRFIMQRLVSHLHDFARETRLSGEEWMTGLNFLRDCGLMCSDVRHEMILLSDTLGLSLLVDNISHPTAPLSTPSSVLGPFHTDDAPHLPNGASMSHDPDGEPMLCVCSVHAASPLTTATDRTLTPLANVSIDIWSTDSSGSYDVQSPTYTTPSERCILHSLPNGTFHFTGILPVSYPIPNDGPVGKLLATLGRHCWRPAHLHFMLTHPGYEELVTALYLKGDQYLSSDAVFGVKSELVVEPRKITREWLAAEKAEGREYGADVVIEEDAAEEGEKGKKVWWLVEWKFVMVAEGEARELREKEAREAVEKLGVSSGVTLKGGLPVWELPEEALD